MTPVTPPIVNVGMKPSANKLAVVNLNWPPQMVNTQLNTLMPVGTAISIVATAKIELAIGPMPVVNIWCAHTIKLKNPISASANTIDP